MENPVDFVLGWGPFRSKPRVGNSWREAMIFRVYMKRVKRLERRGIGARQRRRGFNVGTRWYRATRAAVPTSTIPGPPASFVHPPPYDPSSTPTDTDTRDSRFPPINSSFQCDNTEKYDCRITKKSIFNRLPN